MRNAVRDQILEILSSIAQGLQYAIDTQDETAVSLLDNCRISIEAVGQALESMLSPARFGSYAPLVADLKNEFDSLCQGAASGGVKTEVINTFSSLLSKVEDELRQEPEVRLLAVFLPYKASMWDSLESIWMAASTDPACDTAVIPIPYYEVGPDGSLGELQYEGDLLPAEVPVIYYTDVDLAALKPDIAYIHNAYDHHGLVTRVPEEYYSSNLREHVEKLVYVPYYVNGAAGTPELSKAAGYSSADVVIAQNVADAAAMRKEGPDKLVEALGSPKTDRILRLDRQKPLMPPEWDAALRGKKVFLLNTSLSGLLQFGKSMLDKLVHLLNCFGGREEVAVLWRPHPLSKATLAAMEPKLLAAYHKLEADFLDLKIGVIDATADVERAIALSNAYIGEPSSSLRYMFAITGKPVYLLRYAKDAQFDMQIREELRKLVMLQTFVRDPLSDRWFGVCMGNGRNLSEVNMYTGQVRDILDMPGSGQWDGYSSVITVDRCIYWAPNTARGILKFVPGEGKLSRIKLPEAAVATRICFGVHRYQEYLLFTPAASHAIIWYDTMANRLECDFDWYAQVSSKVLDSDKSMFAAGIKHGSNHLLLPSLQGNYVLDYDLDFRSAKLLEVGKKGNRYGDIAFDGKYYWLTQDQEYIEGGDPTNIVIVRWDFDTGETEEYTAFPEGFEMGEACHGRSIFLCGLLWIFPLFGNMILNLDPKTGEITPFETGLGIDLRERKYDANPFPQNYLRVEPVDEENIFVVWTYDFSLLKINTRTRKVEKVKLWKEKGHYDHMFAPENAMRDHLYHENKYYAVDQFLNDLTSGAIPAHNPKQAKFYREQVENCDGTCGQKVHDFVMGLVTGEANEAAKPGKTPKGKKKKK